ncbi:ABC transporter substrate-binding protein [Roseomonas mucosa]|nr:ABC transporter substrate-binding protein [Roseomonas mucosa]
MPHLATAWRREGDRDLLVTLRPGVRFHNGDTLAAEDVVFTFGRMMGDQPLLVEAKSYFPTLESVTAEGPLAVRFRTRVPDILLEQRLASWCSWIVNKRAYEELGLQGFGQAPVGTGPYRLRSLRRDQAIVLDAFDDYWMGRPTARAVEFRGIPQVAGRTAALLAGDIDLATNIPPDQVEELQGRSGIDLRSVVLANVHVLVFDQRGAGLSDKRVRQALGLAIDRELLVKTLWNGAALVPHSHNFPEYGDMYLPGRSLRYDPDRARALLREAGYDGTEITYRTQANYYTNALPAAQVLVEMWKAVGLNVRLQVVENAAQLRPAAGGQISNWSNSTRACRTRSARSGSAGGPAARPRSRNPGPPLRPSTAPAMRWRRDRPGEAPRPLRHHARCLGGRGAGHHPLPARRTLCRALQHPLASLYLLLHGPASG